MAPFFARNWRLVSFCYWRLWFFWYFFRRVFGR